MIIDDLAVVYGLPAGLCCFKNIININIIS